MSARAELFNYGSVNIAGITAEEKSSTVDDDVLIIKDSEDNYKLKEVLVSDFTGGGSGTGWSGIVNQVADLPTATGSGNFYYVQNPTGLDWSKRSGTYQDIAVATWKRSGNVTFQVTDAQATIYDDADNTKSLQWQLDQISTSTTRTIDSMTLEKAGNVVSTYTNSSTGSNYSQTLSTEMDYLLTRSSGSAIVDFRAIPQDGSSNSDFRYGINIPTTGQVRSIYYDNNSTDIQHLLGSSNTNSYVNNQGGDFGVGTSSPSEKLDVDGNIAVSGTVDGRDIDTDGTKLDGIEAGAEVNNISDANATDLTDGGNSTLHFHNSDRNRSNHTGTQTSSTISDFEEKARIAGAHYDFQADQFENPTNSNWVVNSIAKANADEDDTSIVVRIFDDTVERGIGFSVKNPDGATNITLTLLSRSYDGNNGDVVAKIYRKNIPDDGQISSWNAGVNLNPISMTSDENWHYDSQTVTLSSLGITAGEVTQFELTRVGTDASDDLSGDWALQQLWIEYS